MDFANTLRVYLGASSVARGADGLGLSDLMMLTSGLVTPQVRCNQQQALHTMCFRHGFFLALQESVRMVPIPREMTGSGPPVRSRTTLHMAVLSRNVLAVTTVLTSSPTLMEQPVRQRRVWESTVSLPLSAVRPAVCDAGCIWHDAICSGVFSG